MNTLLECLGAVAVVLGFLELVTGGETWVGLGSGACGALLIAMGVSGI